MTSAVPASTENSAKERNKQKSDPLATNVENNKTDNRRKMNRMKKINGSDVFAYLTHTLIETRSVAYF